MGEEVCLRGQSLSHGRNGMSRHAGGHGKKTRPGASGEGGCSGGCNKIQIYEKRTIPAALNNHQAFGLSKLCLAGATGKGSKPHLGYCAARTGMLSGRGADVS